MPLIFDVVKLVHAVSGQAHVVLSMLLRFKYLRLAGLDSKLSSNRSGNRVNSSWHKNSRMYLWWSLCTLYNLQVRHVRVTADE